MKKQLLTIALIFFGVQFAKATDLYCGASIETVNGSAIYNKQLFLEKVTENKSTIRYLLADGSILTVSSGQIFDSTSIKDGDLMIVISKNNDRVSVSSAKVQRNATQIVYVNTASASSWTSNDPLLMANGASVYCVNH